MKRSNIIKTTIAAAILLALSSSQSRAQFGNTYYHMFGVPQANQLNPAFQPGCDGYLAMPFLGPLRFEASSSSVSFGDIFQWDDSQKKYITFMHPDGDKSRFMNSLDKMNTVRAEVASNIMSFGWRKEQFFFTVDFSERIYESISFPKDMAEFLVYGNLNQDNFNISGLGNNTSFMHEFAIGVSYNLDDEMQFGGRAKLILGAANVETRSSDMTVQTSTDEWHFNSDVIVDASIPYLEVPVDDEGYLIIDSLGAEGTELFTGLPTGLPDLLQPSALSTVGGLKNPGFAIDFGFNYLPIEKLNISAAVLDLGFIRWGNNAYNFRQELDYRFEGIDMSDVIIGEKDMDEVLEELTDSILNSTRIKVTNNKYTNMMSGQVLIGAAYDLTEKVRFGGVFRTRIYNYNFYNQFTVSANVQPISMFSASVSYSVYGKSYMNLGLGLSLRAGPFNLYFITDQAPSAYFFPQEFSSLNFRFGMNIVWGCAKLPKAMKDRPLID